MATESPSFIRGSLVRKLPSYGRWSWLAFTPSCQLHHPVNPSCQPHHQVVGKRKSSEACEFTGENTIRCLTLCFTGMVALFAAFWSWNLSFCMIFAFGCNVLELEFSSWHAICKLLLVVGCCLLIVGSCLFCYSCCSCSFCSCCCFCSCTYNCCCNRSFRCCCCYCRSP